MVVARDCKVVEARYCKAVDAEDSWAGREAWSCPEPGIVKWLRLGFVKWLS